RLTACESNTRTASASRAPRTPRRSSSSASKRIMSARWNASSGTSAPPCNPSSPMRPFLISLLLALSSSAMAACPALLDRKMQTLDERTQPLCDYAGKVLLVVNTASHCGYTPQYDGLEALYRKYRDRGLVVLGFPMNDFGGQEPGSNKEISQFCVNEYAIDFPMFAKTQLKANPLYGDLVRASGQAPRWNFHKYLVDRRGERVQSFGTRIEPNDAKFVNAIERLLEEKQ